MQQHTSSLSQVSEEALEKTLELGNLLTHQGAAFQTTVAQSGVTLKEVSELCALQAEELRRAADEANRQTLKLKETDLEARRDLFLRTASVMLEDLNAQSIDLSRLVEDDLPEEAWKRWRKGDKSIFARRLVRRKEKGDLKVPAIAQRYEKDAQFRQQVSRYITQFESLMNQAAACDPENVLTATFMTADVGKLYLMLSRSVGRGQ